MVLASGLLLMFAIVAVGAAAFMLLVALALSVRRTRNARHREARLSLAFDRARDAAAMR